MHLKKLIEEQLTTLLVIANRYCRNRDEAQDLVHDTVEYTMRHSDKIRSDQHVRPWLILVLKHRYFDYCRRVRPAPIDEGELAQIPAQEYEEEQDWEVITREGLLEAISMLPEDLQRVYRMQADGMKCREIAEALGMPLGTVGTRLRRARSLLRRILKRRLQ
jgi:RNA polymerase sigma-70 factor, ECF subfamily